MRECQRARCWGQHSTFCRLQSAVWRLEPGRLSKGYTSRTACLPQTIPGEGGCFFCFFISAVGCQSQLVDPPPQKRLCVCEARPPLGAAEPRVRSMGLNGSQRGTEGCGGSFAPASIRKKKPRGRLPTLYREAELYLVLSILNPLHSFSNCANTTEIEKKSISISEWLSMPRVALTLWPRQRVR